MNTLTQYEGNTNPGHVSFSPNDLNPKSLVSALRKIQKLRAETDNEYGDLVIRIPSSISKDEISEFTKSSYGKAILNS